MKVLVTGGCGFVGSHLVDHLLAADATVAVVDNNARGHYDWREASRRPHLFKTSILDFDGLQSVFSDFRPDVVYHLAAEHYIPLCEADPRHTFELNVLGTVNVVEVTRQVEAKKLFFTSTGDVYGRTPFANMEAEPANPSTVYGESKLMGELLLRRYWSNVGVPFDITVGRLFNVAGTRETNPHLLPAVVAQAVAGKRTIEVGNLWPLRDFLDVTSVARTIRALTETTQGFDVVNIGSGNPLAVGDALETLFAAAPVPLEMVSVAEKQRPNDRPFLAPDVNRLRGRLGWACDPFNAGTAQAIWSEAGLE